MSREYRSLLVFALIALCFGGGILKVERDARAHEVAVAQEAHRLAYNLCVTRNNAVLVSNQRWQRMSEFLSTASAIRTAQARTDAPALARLDLHYAHIWQASADAIHPLPTSECGLAP